MAQKTISSYFNTRKRPATEDLNLKAKVFINENREVTDLLAKYPKEKIDLLLDYNNEQKIITRSTSKTNTTSAQLTKIGEQQQAKIISGQILKRTHNKIKSKPEKLNDISQLKQQNLVKFIKRGSLSNDNASLSPNKVSSTTSSFTFSKIENSSKTEIGNCTETSSTEGNKIKTNKHENISNKNQINNLIKRELTFEEVKSKVTRSSKLQELKASINRIKELELTRKRLEEKSKSIKCTKIETSNEKQANLKKFDNIELEILTSPQKGFTTPKKLTTPISIVYNKNELMSPRLPTTPKRVLFSPTKSSPKKIGEISPAYQRFQSLCEQVEKTKATQLTLPYKYNFLFEIFKCVESVCSIFNNRKELITFKKLKPAIQRMLRKSFNESHLAQIKQLYPEAYEFAQVKTRNFGSISKQDYYQLVITPIINGKKTCNEKIQEIDESNILKSIDSSLMNPQVLIERQQIFKDILLNLVKNEHDKFLKSLIPPLNIEKNKIVRWHPEFDLEKCPDIEPAIMPLPPDIEKFSSAEKILTTARNLFNCSTPMERIMKRYENKQKELQEQQEQINNPEISSVSCSATTTKTTSVNKISGICTENKETDQSKIGVESILKGVPKSLLDKIKAKQAAKMLDAVTRSKSQENEAVKYSRLPELARHMRNVFITEKKSVLPIDMVLKKIENSYRTNLNQEEIETHIKLIVKEIPEWVEFYNIRRTLYLKLKRNMELSQVIEKLVDIANKKFSF